MTTSNFRTSFAVLSALLVAAGCSSDAVEPGDDVSAGDMTRPDVRVAEMGVDIGVDVDAEADMVEGCTGDCAMLDLTATVGSNSASFDRAVFGLSSPMQSASGGWEVHVEAHAGGGAGCPDMTSPTPDQTVIVTNIPVPQMPTSFGEADGLVVSMLDFAGTLTDELPVTADGESLEWTAWQVCTECAGDDPNGFVAFRLDAPLSNGDISGHVYATHCASLDAR